MDKGIDGMGYWIAAAGLQLCLQMAGIGEADGGIGDRALPSFRADLFLDDAVSDLRIHMRFETGRELIILTRGFTFLRLESRATMINDYWSVFECVSVYLILVLIQN